MHSICFTVGDYPVYWFGVMLALAFLTALLNWTYLGRKEGRDLNYCSDMMLWIMISGVVGARVAFVISEYRDFIKRPIEVFYVHQGGLIFYGGLAGTGLALVVFARMRREKFMSLVDFVITAVPLGHFFGRIGCFLNGCCYGGRYSGILSVVYPRDSLPWKEQLHDGVITQGMSASCPVHPVQLYEAVFNLCLFFLLGWAYRRRRVDGRVTALYLLTYPVGRFLFEFFRGDARMPAVAGLSVAQAVSVALFALGLGIWFMSYRKEKETTRGRS